MDALYELALAEANHRALAHLQALPERTVGAVANQREVAEHLPIGLQEHPIDAERVVRELATVVEPGLVASNGPRYFGFVTGGTLPAAMAADWLTSAWDQNTALGVMSPGAIAVQRLVESWLLELLDLPRDAAVGLTTGAQMANWTCLAAARNKVLAGAGWDVEAHGLRDAPAITVIVGEQRHSTIDRALRFLGLGTKELVVVPADDQGRMRPDQLAGALDRVIGPLIVCAQAGEVNTGAFDPFAPIIQATHARGGWVHVDGAFGLWGRACADRRHLAEGLEAADSWSVDGHKWLNVPYDTGFAITAHANAHAAAMTELAPYLATQDDARDDPMNWSPDASRRARAFAAFAAMRSLGRSGIDELISRTCRLARRFADRLGSVDGIEIVNDVVLNQVLVAFRAPDGGDDDEHTRAVLDRVQHDGTCWAGGTTFRGRAAVRISVSGWATTDDDVDRSVDAILRCAGDVP